MSEIETACKFNGLDERNLTLLHKICNMFVIYIPARLA